jgi:oligopeptide/dipeptide ABC transporter ATP-binding protein
MRQRVMIAMGLACDPDLLIADEPTTALDVTVQAQILALMEDLKERTGAAIILITHDLGVIAEVADRVAVMYAGQIVEEAPVGDIFDKPQHPYTQGLLRSIPHMTERSSQKLNVIPGTVPSPTRFPSGCRFHPRCPERFEPCDNQLCGMYQTKPNRQVRCFLYDEELKPAAAT